MNRFGYPIKFAVLGAMFLLVIGMVSYNLFLSLNQKIQFSQRELEGLSLIRPISQTIQFIQQHRGLSAGQLGGNESLRSLRAGKEKEADEAFQTLKKNLPLKLSNKEGWRAIEKSWERLLESGLGWSVSENYAAHTKLINQLLTFEMAVADEYGLTLDSDYGTRYLIDTAIQKLPQALESLGQTRAYGVGILSQKAVSTHQLLIMNSLLDQLSTWLSFLSDNLGKTGQYNPAIRDSLSSASSDINITVNQIINIVKTEVFTSRFNERPEDFYNTATDAIDKSYAQLYKTILPTAELLIKERIGHAKNNLYLNIGFSLLLVLLAIYFSAGIYYSIVNSVRKLSQSAQNFASGNLGERVNLDTSDELKIIGDSFNAVAAVFGSMVDELESSKNQLEQKVIDRTQSLSLMALVFQQSGEAILITDADNNIVNVNQAFTKMTGYLLEDVRGRNPRMLSFGKTPKETYREMWRSLNEKGFWQGELWDRRKDGHEYPKWTAITLVRDANGKTINHIASFSDMTERKSAEEEIRYLAHHDTLTRLSNRFTLIERLNQAINSASRNQEKVAVMFLDLDRFKVINDTLGHDVGDHLLIKVAQRLKACVRASDIVARLGGDEFVVAVTEVESIEMVFLLADKILKTLGDPYSIAGHDFNSSPSIGIALYPEDGATVDEVMKNADVAMYHAKQMGRNNFQYFDSSMNTASIERLELENEMRLGLERNEFFLHYQPQINLNTGRVIGVEALLRWQHPTKGRISPAMFIPIAEESGWILPLSDWILRDACRQLKVFANAGLLDIRMSINLSARQFNQKTLARTIEQVIIKEGISPSMLELEITENMMMNNPDDAIASMEEIRRIGVKLAIDDFGTGYSSLSYLKKFPVSTLKIDRSFVSDIETDLNDASICSATIALSHSLGLSVVAEGVETEAQYFYLKRMGCDVIQGYLFSQPLLADDVMAFIANHHK